MLKLFYAVGTCALASHITLEEAGADYELVGLDFSSTISAGRYSSPSIRKVASQRW
jgi:hypothetical protein